MYKIEYINGSFNVYKREKVWGILPYWLFVTNMPNRGLAEEYVAYHS